MRRDQGHRQVYRRAVEIEEGSWMGSVNGKRGTFPSNLVEKVNGTGGKYDQSYDCRCIGLGRTTYSGKNCEIEKTSAVPSAAGGNIAGVGGGVAGGFVFILLVVGLIYRHHIHQVKMRAFDFAAELSMLMENGTIDKSENALGVPREVKRSNITMVKAIGQGAFGEVWKGILDESSSGGVPGYMVAIKTAKEAEGAGADDMVTEATVMSQIRPHKNVVSLIGVVTSGLPLLLLISMCEHGSILSFVKERAASAKGKQCAPLSFAQRAKMCLETARGTTYLIASHFIHRDLAARNVLLDSTFQAKIADFGLARGIKSAKQGPEKDADGGEEEYYRSQNGVFPVRWCAPEAMTTMRFSEASDVWSFAIVCLEIFTDGEKPYTGMDNAAVINKVQAGYRAPKPPTCTDEFYAVLLSCWNAKPKKRMPFSQIVTAVGPMVPGGTAITAITFNASRAFNNPHYQGGSKTSLYSQSSSDESLDDYVDMSGQAEVEVNQEAITRARRQSMKRDSEVAAEDVAAAATSAANTEKQEASAKKKKKKTKKKQGSSATQADVNDGGYMTVTSAEGKAAGKKKKKGSSKKKAAVRQEAAIDADSDEDETAFGFADEE